MQVFIIAAAAAAAAAAACLALAAADQAAYAPAPAQPRYDPPGYGPPSYGPPKPYGFEYAVDDPYTGAVFSQGEQSTGDLVTGSYSVQLPDGRTQHVRYTADNVGYGGYNVHVSYEGEAHHPAPVGGYGPAPYAPSY